MQTDTGADYAFDNVTYNSAVAGFSTAVDPATGLLAITFTAGDTFNDNHVIDTAYLWSDALNWSAGAPPSGGIVYMYASGTDNIAGLTLNSLGLTRSATLDVTADLTVDALSLSPDATVVVSNGSTLSIQGPVTGVDNALLQADGTGSVLFDNAPSDPGENYEVSNGRTVVLTAGLYTYNSGLQYDPAGSTGSFILVNPGTANPVEIADIQPGDVLELPGTVVSDVTFDPDNDALSITTDAGPFAYEATYSAPVAGYTTVADPTTGLVAITFTAGYTFNNNDAADSGPNTGNYLWSDALNWAPGIPAAGANVYMDASGIDDIAGLALNSVGLTDNISLTVEANMTTGTLSLAQGSTVDVGTSATFDITGPVLGVPGGLCRPTALAPCSTTPRRPIRGRPMRSATAVR